eukprot:m.14790 g.14790  ORF g.14790 m.14790 type:complete len:514 (+) comp2974_c0_seq1:23-1564(+)
MVRTARVWASLISVRRHSTRAHYPIERGTRAHYPIVIAGKCVDGEDTDLINPATGKAFATYAAGNAHTVHVAAEAAAMVFGAWGARTPAARAQAVLALASALEARVEHFAALESTNTGKPIRLARGEMHTCVDHLRYFAGIARRLDGAAAGEYMAGLTSFLRREPHGVVGAIVPFNYPLMMAVWKIAPAIAAGNTIVLKPSHLTPATVVDFALLAGEAGVPDGVINVVPGHQDAGAALCAHPLVRMIAFTGSSSTGARVAGAAGLALKRVSLELGGKAALIVFPDADLDAAARGAAVGAFTNTGQDCTAVTRVYVHAAVRDAFLARLLDLINRLRVGPPSCETTDIGPLISSAQRDAVHGYVARAREDHIQVAAGGAVPEGPGAYYPPTVLVDAPEDAECTTEEIFGPVVVVNRFETEEQAFALANASRFGLTSSLWTADVFRAMRASQALHTGVVWINDHGPTISEMPHGGYKASGFGKDLSPAVLDEYLQTKHVMLASSPAGRKDWHPFPF